jgi:uncharacterized membrane protein YphA (DoxX/SURF4 family)
VKRNLFGRAALGSAFVTSIMLLLGYATTASGLVLFIFTIAAILELISQGDL